MPGSVVIVVKELQVEGNRDPLSPAEDIPSCAKRCNSLVGGIIAESDAMFDGWKPSKRQYWIYGSESPIQGANS